MRTWTLSLGLDNKVFQFLVIHSFLAYLKSKSLNEVCLKLKQWIRTHLAGDILFFGHHFAGVWLKQVFYHTVAT